MADVNRGLVDDLSDFDNEDSSLLDGRARQGARAAGWFKCRHIMVFLSFLGFVNVYALRVNLSVAMVAMVNSSYETDTNRSTECPADVNPNATRPASTGEFPWHSTLQGQILGSFFYGYIFTQIPGGRLAEMFGGKLLYGLGVLCTSIFTLLTPVAARVPGYGAELLIALRVLEGIGEGVTFPAMHALLAKWAPPLERTKMGTFIYAGSQFGTVISLLVSGIICSKLGWPYVFYIFGVLGCLWFILWMNLVFNSPAEHPRISISEKVYIEKQIGGSSQRRKLPWKAILTSVPVWACAVAHTTYNWGFYTLLTSLPTYMNDILHFDISSNGIISALPYVVMWIVIVLNGQFADCLRTRNILSTTAVRKIFNTIGMVCPALILVGLGYVKCDAKLAVGLLIAAGGMAGFSQSGYNVNHLDLAPPYAGTLIGLTNTAATIPGFLAPQVVGALTNDNHTSTQWRKVFFISAAMYVIGAFFFLIFSSGKEQPWARGNQLGDQEEEHDENSVNKSRNGQVRP